jgi:hypothetical protein
MARWSVLRRRLYSQLTMPNRYIEIPAAVLLIDPSTNKPIPGDDGKDQTWDFELVMQKLLSNPTWGESFPWLRSQDAIYDAWKNAKDGVLILAEEDWLRLKQAIETPKTTITTAIGNQIVNGFGVHPSLVRHLLPLLNAIMDAKAERPKPKAAVPVPVPLPVPEDVIAS